MCEDNTALSVADAFARPNLDLNDGRESVQPMNEEL